MARHFFLMTVFAVGLNFGLEVLEVLLLKVFDFECLLNEFDEFMLKFVKFELLRVEVGALAHTECR